MSNAFSKVERANVELDAQTTARVVESLVIRGDISALSPEERSRFYVQMCESLGLNPSVQPFAILRLNGKEILYPTRGATDQLAAIHRLNREVVEGPEVRDFAGTKLLYCKARVTHPNGRVETAVATLPANDFAMGVMKIETKAKRRATLAILGLAMLDETEVDSIPAHAKQHVPQITVTASQPYSEPPDATPAEVARELGGMTPLDELREQLLSVETREALRTVWHELRAAIQNMDAEGAALVEARRLMWECAESQGLARTKKELAEILGAKPTPPPDGPKGGKRAPANDAPVDDDAAERAAIEAEARDAAQAKAPDVVAEWKRHVATKKNAHELANSWRKHRGEWGAHYDACTDATLDALMVLLASNSRMACMTFLSNQARQRAA
jgi:hypothetical protein